MKLRTWHFESALVIFVLGITTYLTGNKLSEWIGSIAVFCAFSHASISQRLAEREERKTVPDVECYWKLIYFFIAKEILFGLYFIMHQSYIALIGVGLFILYPIWRKLWRKYHPLNN